MKQTAVEWLFDELIELNAEMKYHMITWEDYLSKRADLLEQAKEMELEKLKEAYSMGRLNKSIKEFNKTFKSE